MTHPRRVLVLNCGSSTLKWTLLDAATEASLLSGDASWKDTDPEQQAARIEDALDRAGEFDAAGHRIVHGGTRFRETALVDVDVRAGLEALVRLDALHMRSALACVDAVRARKPQVPQYAAFDTAFHSTLSEAAAGYGLPADWSERWDLRRYGFHGLSVSHAVRRAGEMNGQVPPRMVVCHLGSGCSVTAVERGRSVDTTMGFTPLEGLVMATRSGSVDPGLLLHLQLDRGVAAGELLDVLTHRSGLLGISGLSSDLREVIAAMEAGSARAKLAYERFILAAKRAVGAMTGVLGGLDALVFTGGVGENSARVRYEIAAALAFAGAQLDEQANSAALPDCDIAKSGAPARIYVVRAREDLVILRDVLRCARQAPGSTERPAAG